MFKPFGKSNPCPVCGSEDGACRHSSEDENFILCHTYQDAKKLEKINGFICVKPSHGSHTASFKPDNTSEWTETQRKEWKSKKDAQELKAQEAERQQQERALSAERRHQLYSQIFEQLSLDPVTLADLERRGFSQEEIEGCGFKSVVAGQTLDQEFTHKLPGIGYDGRSLAIRHNGYLCPIFNLVGEIVAFQLRLDSSPDNNRYRWLSTPSTATLKLYPEGENPLTVLRPYANAKPEGIALVEGTGAKPFLCARRLKLLVVGAAGGQWSSSPKLFKKYLEQLYYEVGGEKTITLYPDAGDVGNKNVITRWRKVANLLVDWGWQVRFAWWGQVDKSFPDIDELKSEEYSTIRYLSIAEFKTLCVKWGGLQAEEINNLVTLDYEERVAQAQRRLHSLSYPVDLVCDPSKKYLPNLVGRIPTKGIVGLKSPKGSGKSHQIKLIKEHCCGHSEERIILPEAPETPPEQLELFSTKTKSSFVEAPLTPQIEKVRHKGLGMNFLSINARIALGREQAIRWEFTWIEDADLEAKTEFEGAKLSTSTILENIGEIGLCWDSLGKIFGRDWSNTLVVIDEIELGLNHVATSSTCRDRRSFILHTLEHKLKECLDNDGLVLVADADLTDTSLDYLTTIAPGHPPFIVSHDFKGDPWEIDFYTGKRDVVLSQIEDWLADENCRPIAVAVDNQKEAESLSMFLMKKYPWLSQEVGGLIRIDSRVTQTDYGKDFVKRPNESIQKYQPRVLIYTPSLGVGCSIDIEYFAHVFGLFFGNLEPSQGRQMLARVRQAVPRTVWAKDRASNSENETTSYLPEEIKRRMFDYHDTTSALINLAVTIAKERTENSESDKDLLPNLVTVLQEMMDKESGTWNNPHIDLYCCQVARRNFALNQFAVQLRQELIDEGHRINDEEGDSKTNAGDEVRYGKEEIKRRDATLTANAKDITFEQAQEIKHKPARTTEEEHSASKAFLKRELPEVELTADFLYKAVYKDNRRWLNQAKLYWWCLNPDAIKHDDSKEWKAKLKQFSKGVPFLPDIKTYTPKVDAILKSGLFQWIDPNNLEALYCDRDEGGKQFLNKALGIRKLLKTALGITVTHDSEPVALANRILDRLGLAVRYHRKEQINGERIRYYKLDEELATDSDRQAVWSALNLRWQNEISQIAQSQSQQSSEGGQNSPKSLYNNQSSVHLNKPEELPQNPVVDHATEEWLDPENLCSMSEDFKRCDNSDELLPYFEFYPDYAIAAAVKLLPMEFGQWVLDWLGWWQSETHLSASA
jgi:hypothetical protein